MDDREREAWDSVVGNLSKCILGDDDFKVRVISGWLDAIRGTDLNCDSVFLTRLFICNLVKCDGVVGDGGDGSGNYKKVLKVTPGQSITYVVGGGGEGGVVDEMS